MSLIGPNFDSILPKSNHRVIKDLMHVVKNNIALDVITDTIASIDQIKKLGVTRQVFWQNAINDQRPKLKI